MIATSHLQHQYPGRPMLCYPNINAQREQPVLVLGKSGCGKSTLLHLLAGLIRPTAGEITIKDQIINHLSNGALDAFRGKHIGLVFQKPHFVQALSVSDNILLAPRLSGKQVDYEKLHFLGEKLRIENLLKFRPARLSAGEQQRVAIARALVHAPELLLADEPTSALDDENAFTVASLLTKLCNEMGAALVIVTHDERIKNIVPHHIHLS